MEPNDDLLDPEDSEDPEGSTDSPEDQGDADPIAQLRADIEARDKERDARLESLTNDFKRTVGRLQSLTTKLNDSTPAQRQEINQQIERSQQLIDLILDGLDETAIDPGTRDKVRKLRADAQTEAEWAKREAALLAKVQPQQDPEDDTSDAEMLSQVAAFEAEIVEEINSYDIDPADFDWAEATKILIGQGTAATKKWFRERIREKLSEQSAATQRTAKKATASSSPKPAGAPRKSEDVLHDRGASLDDRIKALRSMGALP